MTLLAISDTVWTAFLAGLPATISALSCLIVAIKSRRETKAEVAEVKTELKTNTDMTRQNADRADVLEKQGNSTQETALRMRKALAERNCAELDNDSNRAELSNATIALDTHLAMQARVDAMQIAKIKAQT